MALIYKFPEFKIVDLTGGAPEMNYGFKPLVEAATFAGKKLLPVQKRKNIFLSSNNHYVTKFVVIELPMRI